MIHRISTMFVPVAVNLYQIRVDRGPGGTLFHSVQKQMPQYQGFWIVSPEGKALARQHEFLPDVPLHTQVLDKLEAGLKAFGPVTPRNVKPADPHPHRGCGVRPDASVSLALYTRLLNRLGQRDGPASLDTLTLSTDEWKAVAPLEGLKAGRWVVRGDVARKFSRLLPPTSGQTMPRPENIREAELKGSVESTDGSRVRIRFAGRWESEEPAVAHYGITFLATTGEGEAVYDSKCGTLISFLLVCRGTQRQHSKESTPRETGAVVEWRTGTEKETNSKQ